MTPQDLARRVRELESQDLLAAATELRWQLACALSGSDLPAHSVLPPAPSGEDAAEFAPSCRLSAALRDAESAGDLATCDRLLAALARLERRAA